MNSAGVVQAARLRFGNSGSNRTHREHAPAIRDQPPVFRALRACMEDMNSHLGRRQLDLVASARRLGIVRGREHRRHTGAIGARVDCRQRLAASDGEHEVDEPNLATDGHERLGLWITEAAIDRHDTGTFVVHHQSCVQQSREWTTTMDESAQRAVDERVHGVAVLPRAE